MNSTMEKLSSNQVRIDFTVEPELFEKGVQRAYKKNVGKINVPGFRRGKAPRMVIEAMYGKSVFYEDAVDEIFPEIYDAAVKEHGITAVDRPSLTKMNVTEDRGLELTVEVYVRPEFTLSQYKGLSIERHVTYVTDDDVAAEIERARERVSRYVDVEDRAVKLDDQITLDYAGSVDGEPFEGGTAQDARLVIGSGSFIPGFEDQLIGAEIGSEVEVNVTFPEDYHAEELRGKAAVFKCTVKSIQEKDVPELDDEFAKDVSEFETLEEYRADVRAKLEKAAADRDNEAFENEILDTIREDTVIDVPQAMIDRQTDRRLSQFAMNMSYRGIGMDMYYRITGQTEESLRGEMKEQAEKDVRTQLIMEKIADEENITPDDDEIEAEIDRYAEQSGMEAEKFRETLTDEDRENFREIARWNKTMAFLKASCAAAEPAAEPAEKEETEE